MSVLSLCRYNDATCLLAVHHLYRSVRHKCYLLLKGTLVLWQLTAQLFVPISWLVLAAILLVVTQVCFQRCCLRFQRVVLLESFVSFLKERHMVVQLLKIKLSVDIYLAVVGNSIAKRCSIFKVGTSHPIVGCIVRRIRCYPVEYWQQVDRQLIRCLERLIVVKRCTHMLY